VLLAFLIAPAAAVAVVTDHHVPPWWRGQERTTSQIWYFLDDVREDVLPDGPALGGWDPLPSTMLDVTPGPNMGWLGWDNEREGVWQLSGSMDVIVDNFDPPNDEKRLWVQITWRPQIDGAKPTFGYVVPAPSPDYPVTLVEETNLEHGWIHSTYEWRLDYNPTDEFFGFFGKINVDELVIDTWCIPEPGTIASLIGLGLTVGLIFWRRRK
jgi:hypothetical protein